MMYCSVWASLVAQTVKNLPAMRETWVLSLAWEDPLEEGMATHSSILFLPRESLWTEELGACSPWWGGVTKNLTLLSNCSVWTHWDFLEIKKKSIEHLCYPDICVHSSRDCIFLWFACLLSIWYLIFFFKKVFLLTVERDLRDNSNNHSFYTNFTGNIPPVVGGGVSKGWLPWHG